MISALIAMRDSAVASVLLKNQNCRQPRHEFETRFPPGSLAASHRGFAFCVADPIASAHEPARIDPTPIDSSVKRFGDHSCNSCLFTGRARASEAHAPAISPHPRHPRNPWLKKFSSFEIFRELRLGFPGLG